MNDIFKEISNQICNDAKKSTEMSRQRTEIFLKNEVADYETSQPKIYKHTYELLKSPKTTDVSGGKKNLNFVAYMDENISYDTGSYSGSQVISATEIGHSNTIGNHGYFQRTENAIPLILDECLGAFFIKKR